MIPTAVAGDTDFCVMLLNVSEAWFFHCKTAAGTFTVNNAVAKSRFRR